MNICHHLLTSSTQLQNRSFHVVERTRTSAKCEKMKNARAKRVRLLFFVVKYANLWRSCYCRRRDCSRILSRIFFSSNENGTVKQNNQSDFKFFLTNQSHCRKMKDKKAIRLKATLATFVVKTKWMNLIISWSISIINIFE